MPIYVYDCKACNKRHELLMKMSSDPPKCPDCGEDALQKMPAGGTDFYIDGYSYSNGYSRECISYDGRSVE